jgi:hypothetical protein
MRNFISYNSGHQKHLRRALGVISARAGISGTLAEDGAGTDAGRFRISAGRHAGGIDASNGRSSRVSELGEVASSSRLLCHRPVVNSTIPPDITNRSNPVSVKLWRCGRPTACNVVFLSIPGASLPLTPGWYVSAFQAYDACAHRA